MCIGHCTFWQQYCMLMTHCMLCRNLVFWKNIVRLKDLSYQLDVLLEGEHAFFWKWTCFCKACCFFWRHAAPVWRMPCMLHRYFTTYGFFQEIGNVAHPPKSICSESVLGTLWVMVRNFQHVWYWYDACHLHCLFCLLLLMCLSTSHSQCTLPNSAASMHCSKCDYVCSACFCSYHMHVTVTQSMHSSKF